MESRNGLQMKPYRGGRIGTVGLLIKIACFVKKKFFIIIIEAADLNKQVSGGQLY
jgi:hypothetical protein